MFKFFVILLIVITFGCVHYANIFKPNVIENAIESLAIVRTEGMIKVNERIRNSKTGMYEFKKVKKPFKLRATAIHLENGYILALTHATKIPIAQQINTPFGYIVLAQEVLSEKWFLNGDEITIVGRYEDISLFKSNSEKVFPFAFGNSDKVRIGTKVVVLGWSFSRAVNIKDGIISRKDIKEGTYDTYTHNCFLFTAPTNPGDSGSPLIAYRQGKFELIGIVNANFQDGGMGFAFKSNFVKNAIRKIKNG